MTSPHLPPLRIIDRTLPTIEENLALDEACLLLAEEAGAGPLLRFWEPDAPAVVLGASSRLLDDVDVGRCQADGVAIARRSSGGGTVVVGPGTLNVAVVLPIDADPEFGKVDSAQRGVLERLAEGLRGAGPDVRVRGSGDLTIGDRKFGGSAQRRLRRYFLVHASLLYRFPIDRIARWTRQPRRQPAYRADRPHEAFLTHVPVDRDALTAAILAPWPIATEQPPPEVPDALVDSLLAEKFRAAGWVERF